MAFTVQDYSDLTRLLGEHPEWQSELRRLVLSSELLTLPETVRELAEAQRRTEVRVGELAEAQRRTEVRVGELAEAQRRTEERLSQMEERLSQTEERLSQVEERLSRLEATVQNLAEQMSALIEQVRALTEAQQHTTNTVSGLKGLVLELTYRHRAGAYFGPLLRRVQVVEPHTLEDTLEASLSPGEFRDVLRLDLLVSGRPRHRPEAPEVWLAMEVSAVVDRNDVDRAERRAKLLQQAGYRALPVVAGEQVTLGGEGSARAQKVVLVQDGQISFWDEAMEAWAT